MQLKGLGVSPGIGIGRALVVTRGTRHLRFRIPERRIPSELERLDAARDRAREQIARIKQRITAAAGTEQAYIFEAQRLMLDDPRLVDRAAAIIRAERLNAESALERALDEISALFDQIDDPYLRERKGDVADVVGRLCMNLRGGGDPIELFRDVDGPLVLVAEELSPSLIAQLDFHRLAAFVTDAGSWTYHTAILARSIHLPAVAGVRHASGVIAPGALLAVDGASGQVWIDPPPDQLIELEARSKQRRAYERSLEDFVALPSVTLDGTPIRIEANVELPEEAARARLRGAEGIGLYRSEFLLAGTSATGLDEEAQYLVYRQLIDAMGSGRVTVRTFDVTEAQMGLTQGVEPVRSPLGLRGLRLSLSFEEVFQAQLRALLRAAAHGPLRIMFPFVTGVEEVARRPDSGRPGDRGAARPRYLGSRGADWDHDRGPVGRADDRSARRRGRFRQHRHQRPDPVLPGGGSDGRSRLRACTRRCIPRSCACCATSRAGARRGGLPVSVCGEMAADPVLLPLLDRPRAARVQHDAECHSRRQTRRPQPAAVRHGPPGKPRAEGGYGGGGRKGAGGVDGGGEGEVSSGERFRL